LNELSSFERLLSSSSLKQLQIKYPNLRQQLRSIYDLTVQPSRIEEHGASYPELGLPRERDKDGEQAAWTQAKALKRAQGRMKRLRAVDGPEGEGLREFTELVRALCKAEEESAGTVVVS
jgi:hypothetical protein